MMFLTLPPIIGRMCVMRFAAGSLIAIRLVYNLLKQHPSCKKLIHNTGMAP